MRAIQLVTMMLRRRRAAECRPARAGCAVACRQLRLACGLLALLAAWAAAACAQTIVTDTGAPAASFMAPLSVPGLQPFWVGYVGADRGLGFQGQYFSIGSLMPITTDVLDGTWFVDGRAHLTTDNTQFFSNLGIGRRCYISPFNSILGISGWYDYDGDAYQGYGYRYNQLGATGEFFNPLFDFRVNGYFPVGTTSHNLNEFTQNYLLYVNGIDTAMHGGDFKFSVRPAALGALNGYIDIGGYAFKSPDVPAFGGVSTGFGVQALPGVAVNMEVNHDQVFGTTGFVRVAFGLRGTPGNSRVGNRLLEPTRRNDHIVRFNQQPQIATDPSTSSPYHVIHVDNTAPSGGNGTSEHPFNSLSAAQAASAANDIIYVHTGNGTTQNYNTGIVLKDNQMLLGSGSNFVMQTTEIGPFLLRALDSTGPVITNPAGAAVTLANNDRVGGMTISAAQYGIIGTSVTNFTMESNKILNSGLDGVLLTNFSGLGLVTNNRFIGNGEDGFHAFGGDANYTIQSNTFEQNIRNGIFFDSGSGSALVTGNVLGSNGFGNWAGLHVLTNSGTFIADATKNSAQGNTEGILLESNGPGTLDALVHDNLAISYNLGDGIQIAARGGSTLNFQIVSNPINFNGLTNSGGAGLRMYAQDSVLDGTIANNFFTNNAGSQTFEQNLFIIDEAAGISGQFVGNSITSFNIVSNQLDGYNTDISPFAGPNSHFGDGIQLSYDLANTFVQVLNFQNNSVQNSRGIGVLIEAFGLTKLDTTLNGNNISNSFDSGVAVFATDEAVVRVTATNNVINGNVSPINNPSLGMIGSDGGVSLDSISGDTAFPSRIIASFANNDISFNGEFQNPPSTTGAYGISANTSGAGVMALQVFGNRIIDNGQSGINLVAANQIPPSAFSASLVAEIRDNMLGTDRITAAPINGLTAVQGFTNGETPANQSIMLVELTHNESNKPFEFTNTQTTPLASIVGIEDGGLNTASILINGGGLFSSLFPGSVAAAIAPMLVFP